MKFAYRNLVPLLFAPVVAFIAVVVFKIRNENLENWNPDASDWAHAANFTRREVPTIFYDPDQLNSILKSWDDSPIRVYRLKDGHSFPFDMRYINSSVGARKVIRDCDVHPNIFCRPCTRASDTVLGVDAQTVFNDPNLIASFANFSKEAEEQLKSRIDLDWLRSKSALDHVFLSNMKEPYLSAQMHAATLASSLSIQYQGSKTWLFIPADHFLSKNGFNAQPLSSFLTHTRAPKGNFDIYLYKSQPGDLLFFREAWGHSVYTSAGPNLMINYRYPNIGNFLRIPLTWAHQAYYSIKNKRIKHEGVANPANVYSNKVIEKQTASLCSGGKVTQFDKDLYAALIRYADYKNLN